MHTNDETVHGESAEPALAEEDRRAPAGPAGQMRDGHKERKETQHMNEITMDGIVQFRARVVQHHAEELRRIDGFIEVLEGKLEGKLEGPHPDPLPRGEGRAARRRPVRPAPLVMPGLEEREKHLRLEDGSVRGGTRRVHSSSAPRKGRSGVRGLLSEFAKLQGARGFTVEEATAGVKARGLRGVDYNKVKVALFNMLYAGKMKAEGSDKTKRYFAPEVNSQDAKTPTNPESLPSVPVPLLEGSGDRKLEISNLKGEEALPENSALGRIRRACASCGEPFQACDIRETLERLFPEIEKRELMAVSTYLGEMARQGELKVEGRGREAMYRVVALKG